MREDSPPLEDAFPTLGTLTLLRRKTGEVAQTFPIDAERITFGRDYDCDVRLYLQDVSKIHAEIQFDLDTGAAALKVLGTNGVIHTPAGGKAVQLKAPSQVTLADGDTFAIRKKLFRFAYGEPQDLPVYASPMVARTMPATPARHQEAAGTPVRRRASMRLSIVPEGKRFVPSPAKPRASGLGLHGATPSKTPAKSSLSRQVELEAPQEFDELLAVEEGDEGDKLFLELKDEDDVKPVYRNPFMTPQPKSKIQMRNTSAVPRTRKLQFVEPAHEPEAEDDEYDARFENAVEQPPAPATPTSIPLPCPAGTPYSLPMTPVRLPVPAISAQLAYSVPRGPVSLHKSVVIRNGWKAEQNSQPKDGIDAEIAKGHIETRRRRSSSGLSAGRKSLSPKVPEPASESSSESGSASEMSDDDKENTPASPASLQWVYENGTEDASHLDDSDSDGGSFEFDHSVPGQGMIDFNEVSGESLSEEEEESGEELEDEEDSGEELQDEEEVANSDGPEDISSDIDDVVDSSNVVDPASLAGERSPSPVLPARFCASPPTRPGLGSPRLSLSSIGGPAVRFTPKQPPTPSYGRGFPMTPTGKLGPPSRAERTPVPVSDLIDASDEDDDADDEEAPAPIRLVPSTPKTPRLPNGGLSQAQRDALGTPRDLPPPPPSFRNAPTPSKPETPSLHRVFEPTAPEEALSNEPPRTPFEDIKRRLSALRIGAQTSARKRSSESLPRRATVGFALPETPSKEASSSRAPQSMHRPVPATPRVAAIEEASESLPSTPTAGDTDAQPLTETSPTDTSTPKHKRRRSLVSPSFAGLREMLKTPKDKEKEPKSPSMAGVRNMFKTPKAAPSPQLDGVREMYREPRHVRTPSLRGLRNLLKEPEERASPSLTGVKELMREERVPPTPAMGGEREVFAQREVPPTPGFEGVAEMYEEERVEAVLREGEGVVAAEVEPEEVAAEVEASEVAEDAKDVDQPVEEPADEPAQPSESDAAPSQPSSPDKPTTRTRSRLPRSTASVSAPTRRTQPAPAAEPPKPARATRTRKAATPAAEPASEPVRRSTRAKSSAPTTSEDETRSAPAPARRTRAARTTEPAKPKATRTAKAKEEEEVKATKAKPEAKSAPVRRSRRVLGETEGEAETKEAGKKTRSSSRGGKENAAEVGDGEDEGGVESKTRRGRSGIAVPARSMRSRK